MSQDLAKRKAAEAALAYVQAGRVLGVGTGSTVNIFIDLLAESGLAGKIKGAVSSSNASSERLQKIGVPVLDLNSTGELSIYVDGADESNPKLQLIKGGGAALTREKIVAAASEQFICIVDRSKQVEVLGRFPLPVEVIPMAQAYVARRIEALGGQPKLRQNVITDNGNQILDVHGLAIHDAVALETEINLITGVVCVGLFARRGADVLIVGTPEGAQIIKP
ncbi:ribose-5-phosphate isomerase [Solimonas aquatica]|uniref:Ribose-5-phosphate isomerase A n=1 Tax=Solimonas aquatica TaxID=489703 RepID=A0A1H9D168_9GAMM|nr:ribose-5-phosphate isomerase RpiA [Solimonas aquatica]SEQ07117.1 ribose-5-phosphate isomerase [Solimonas aquatica]